MVTALALAVLTTAAVDVKIGDDFRLECRFNANLMDKKPTFYWIRSNVKEKDNVAIGDTPLEKNYRCVAFLLSFFFFGVAEKGLHKRIRAFCDPTSNVNEPTKKNNSLPSFT